MVLHKYLFHSSLNVSKLCCLMLGKRRLKTKVLAHSIVARTTYTYRHEGNGILPHSYRDYMVKPLSFKIILD